MITPINRKEGKCDCYPHEHCPICDPKFFSKGGDVQMPEPAPYMTSPETPSSESGRGEIKTPDDFDRRYKELEQEADDKVGEGVVSHLDILEIVLREFQVDATQSFKSSLLTFLHEKAEEQRKCAERWKNCSTNNQYEIHSRASNSFQEVITWVKQNS